MHRGTLILSVTFYISILLLLTSVYCKIKQMLNCQVCDKSVKSALHNAVVLTNDTGVIRGLPIERDQ